MRLNGAGRRASEGPTPPAQAGARAWAVPVLVGGAVLGVFAWHVHRYFFLCDDAFITFRYARNWVHGPGLVWNPGEVVEGYTNFLWMVVLALGMRLGIAPEVLAPALGIASGVAILLLLAGFAARRHGWRDPLVWLPPGALAVNRSFAAWSTSGLETQLFSLSVLAGLLLFCVERERGDALPWRSSLCLALAALTRPNGVLFAFAVGLLFLADVVRGRRGLRSLLVWCAPLAVIVGSHLLWRRAYYGFWVPNSFYAKVHGLWWEQSSLYLSLFLEDYKLHWFLPWMALGLFARRRFEAGLFALAAAVQLAYLTYVGGDFLEFRFLVPILPYLYWLVAEGVRALLALRRGSPVLRGAAALLSAAALLGVTWQGSERPEARRSRHHVESVVGTAHYGRLRSSQGKALRALVERGLLPPDLRVSTGGAGALPYYTGWYVLDEYGLNDVRVAHQPVEERGRVAHETRASLGYLREKRIAVKEIGPRLLYDVRPRELPGVLRVARKTVRAESRRAERPEEELRLECRAIRPGAYLIFATNLEEPALREVLGHLDVCPGT